MKILDWSLDILLNLFVKSKHACIIIINLHLSGASTDEKIFDSCNPFRPENTSMITMRENGENLYIKFSSDEVDVDIGFAILFKLKGK